MFVFSSTSFTGDWRGRAIGNGGQSQVELIESGQLETSLVVKRMGIGKHLSHEEAYSLYAQLPAYWDALKLSGWNIPNMYDVAVYAGKRGLYIYSYEEYIDGQSVGAHVADKKWEIFRQLFSLLAIQRSVLWSVGGRILHRLRYGVDLKPDNLVFDNAGRVYLVDTFGPKTINERGKWMSYVRKLERLDEESLMVVTATREGMILRFLRLAEKGWSVEFAESEMATRLHDCLLAAGISPGESEFIISEVKRSYPWLDELYNSLAGE